MTMYVERDTYYAAWAIEHGATFEIRQNKLYLMANDELRQEYNALHRCTFARIRTLVKELNRARTASTGADQ